MITPQKTYKLKLSQQPTRRTIQNHRPNNLSNLRFRICDLINSNQSSSRSLCTIFTMTIKHAHINLTLVLCFPIIINISKAYKKPCIYWLKLSIKSGLNNKKHCTLGTLQMSTITLGITSGQKIFMISIILKSPWRTTQIILIQSVPNSTINNSIIFIKNLSDMILFRKEKRKRKRKNFFNLKKNCLLKPLHNKQSFKNKSNKKNKSKLHVHQIRLSI